MISRRGLQWGLGVVWLLDGALQLQPYMFGKAFAREVLAPTADGQPRWVAAPVHETVQLVLHAPAAFNAAFAIIQLALGVGLFWRRTVRLALAASVVWSLAVWWLGEGLGGVASGSGMLLDGLPGAVLLYALIAVAAWPSRGGQGQRQPPRWFAVLAWAVVWVGGALFQLLPGQDRASDVVGAISDSAGSSPHWLAHLDHAVAGAAGHPATIPALVVVCAAVGLGAFVPGAVRTVSVLVGCVLALVFWAVGQGLGDLFSGQATDPNSGPLLVLLGVAVVGVTRTRAGQRTRAARPPRADGARTPARSAGATSS